MMFNFLAINNAINFVNSFNKKIKVLDLGCQTYEKKNKLEIILSHKLLKSHQKNSFKNLFKKKENITTKDFYLALGCLKYDSIDINGDLDDQLYEAMSSYSTAQSSWSNLRLEKYCLSSQSTFRWKDIFRRAM